MAKVSAGILLFRQRSGNTEVLLVHPGGPFWKNKDAGAWSIPKGEVNEGEELLATAQREFQEEVGTPAAGPFISLEWTKQKAGKIVHCWASPGDFDPPTLKSNTFRIQWPPRSDKWITVPEVDRADWFSLTAAREKILEAQAVFLDRLEKLALKPT